jgi:hypothetical protein
MLVLETPPWSCQPAKLCETLSEIGSEHGSGKSLNERHQIRASITMDWERAVSDMEERESRRESRASVW